MNCRAAGRRTQLARLAADQAARRGADRTAREPGQPEEIERWVLRWGAHARVLEPPELKRRIRGASEAILASS